MFIALCKHGDLDKFVYILKDGLLRKETPVTISQQRKWPISHNKWKLKEITKTKIHSQDIHPGEIAGLENVCKQLKPMQSTIRAVKDSMVLEITKEHFLSIFNDEED